MMTLLDSTCGRTDEAVMNFSIQRARAAAWRVAERLAPLALEEMRKEIDVLDRWGLTERRDVEKIIDVLALGEHPNLRVGTDISKK